MVGVAVHQAAMDGHGLLRFLEMSSAAAATVATGVREVLLLPLPPLHDRMLVWFDDDDELAQLFLR